MKIKQLSFEETGFFSKTMLDYTQQHPSLDDFYTNYPTKDGFQKQIDLKKSSFSKKSRQLLMDSIENQYGSMRKSEATSDNIQKLGLENTYTITTGHQLNLFTGPLYFVYKILATINLCEELESSFPDFNFVPIYWMATEDHDFEEINFFNFKGKKVQWNAEQQGGVGRFTTEGLEEVLEVFAQHLGTSKNARYLKELFEKAYAHHSDLASATRFLVNELFGAYGLVIIDGDRKELKQQFIPYIKTELQEQIAFREVSKTSASLKKNYKVQVNPRAINLFYLRDGLRERIVEKEGVYAVKNTDIHWNWIELEEEIEQYPERFSPNVIMRPLYQEVILPNLCYIGGGGELAYWLQLKGYFEHSHIPFPMLLLRNSVQIISEKQAKKLRKLNIDFQELFLKQNDLLQKKVIENAEDYFSFQEQEDILKEQFLKLKAIAKKTDVSFIGAVEAQERKQIKGLENLEKRLLRAEKRKQRDRVERIVKLQNDLLPNHSLEERQRNFSEFYLEYGSSFIGVLKDNLQPLDAEFSIFIL